MGLGMRRRGGRRGGRARARRRHHQQHRRRQNRQRHRHHGRRVGGRRRGRFNFGGHAVGTGVGHVGPGFRGRFVVGMAYFGRRRGGGRGRGAGVAGTNTNIHNDSTAGSGQQECTAMTQLIIFLPLGVIILVTGIIIYALNVIPYIGYTLMGIGGFLLLICLWGCFLQCYDDAEDNAEDVESQSRVQSEASVMSTFAQSQEMPATNPQAPYQEAWTNSGGNQGQPQMAYPQGYGQTSSWQYGQGQASAPYPPLQPQTPYAQGQAAAPYHPPQSYPQGQPYPSPYGQPHEQIPYADGQPGATPSPYYPPSQQTNPNVSLGQEDATEVDVEPPPSYDDVMKV